MNDEEMNRTEPKSAVRTDQSMCPSPHSLANKLARLLWQVVWMLVFRPSPWFLHAPRRLLLRLFGAHIGRGVQIMPSVKIWAPWNLLLSDYATVSHGVDLYDVDRIEIGSHATISQRAVLCTASHAVDHPNMPVVTSPVTVMAGAWVAAEAFLLPGVNVGVDAVVAARAVVVRDVPVQKVVAGNPARVIRSRIIHP